jgi:hypothetical protein
MEISELEKRLISVENELRIYKDIEEVKNLHYKYVNSLIKNNWDDLLDCFSESCTADFGSGSEEGRIYEGKDAIKKLFNDEISKAHIGREGVFVVHPLIKIDGDTAAGNWLIYIMNVRSRSGYFVDWMQGYYDTKYIKENNKWKFSYFKYRARLTKTASEVIFKP